MHHKNIQNIHSKKILLIKNKEKLSFKNTIKEFEINTRTVYK